MAALEEDLKRFLTIGYGYCDGYGYGDGDGYGYGYGDGSGSGSGYGYCDGYGYGSGYGDGDGDGYGDGYGYGIKEYAGRNVYIIDGVQTLIDSVHRNYAKGSILKDDLTLQPCYIAKVGNYFAHGKTLKEAMRDAQAKYDESLPIEERIANFKKQYHTLDTKAKGKELYDWHHVLTGSCRMGRDEFCRANDVSMDAEYTIEYFLSLTKDSYGSDVIRQVRESYK